MRWLASDPPGLRPHPLPKGGIGPKVPLFKGDLGGSILKIALLVGLVSLVPAVPGAIAAETATKYLGLGLQYRQQGQFAKAIEAFKKSVELNPNRASSWILLGWTQHLAAAQPEAIASLIRAIQVDKTQVQAFNALGIVYLVQDELEWTLFTHHWALGLKPDNEIAYYNLSLAYERRKEYEKAIVTAQRAAELEPSNPHPLIAEALAHWGTGDKPAAKQAMQRALSLNGQFRDRAYRQEDLTFAAFSSDQIERVELVLAATL